MSFGFGGFGQNNQSPGFGTGSGFGGTSTGGGRFLHLLRDPVYLLPVLPPLFSSYLRAP